MERFEDFENLAEGGELVLDKDGLDFFVEADRVFGEEKLGDEFPLKTLYLLRRAFLDAQGDFDEFAPFCRLYFPHSLDIVENERNGSRGRFVPVNICDKSCVMNLCKRLRVAYRIHPEHI